MTKRSFLARIPSTTAGAGAGGTRARGASEGGAGVGGTGGGALTQPASRSEARIAARRTARADGRGPGAKLRVLCGGLLRDCAAAWVIGLHALLNGLRHAV